MEPSLSALSEQLSETVAAIGASAVSVHGRSRFGASGVVWRPGVVVSAAHLLAKGPRVALHAADGEIEGEIAGRDPGTDLTVIRAEGLSGEPPSFGDPGALRPGQLALAVGRSAEAGVTAALGSIAAVGGERRSWSGGRLDRYIRLDMGLYPGFSGGALANPEGQTLGIVTAGLSRFWGLAVPVETVDRVADALLAKGRVTRGYLGVGLQPVRLQAPPNQSPPQETGLIVLTVEPNGPAHEAGVLVGDILIKVGERAVADTDDVQAALEGDVIGRPTPVELVRGGGLVSLQVSPVERKGR